MMLVVLGLIDVVMISNLLIMVIVGGYETFVSRMRLEGHPDQPEWLSHVNASVLKVKLATAIIGISSIHLLKTFINAKSYDAKALIAQTTIHVTFLLSALAVAAVDRIMPQGRAHARTRADQTPTDAGAAWPRSGRTTSSRASPTRCSSSRTTTRRTTSTRWARPTAPRSRRPRRTRSRRSSPIRACAPRAIARSARTPASSSRS